MKRHPRPHQILALKANISIHSVPTTNSPSPRINSMPHSLLVTHLVTYLIFANPSTSETQSNLGRLAAFQSSREKQVL